MLAEMSAFAVSKAVCLVTVHYAARKIKGLEMQMK
jgi:hypothetical protein